MASIYDHYVARGTAGQEPPPVIVCSAIRHPVSGVVVCGPRHGDCLNYANQHKVDSPNVQWELGFVDQYNNFLTRSEACRMGQVRRPTGYEPEFDRALPPHEPEDGLLFSENLY